VVAPAPAAPGAGGLPRPDTGPRGPHRPPGPPERSDGPKGGQKRHGCERPQWLMVDQSENPKGTQNCRFQPASLLSELPPVCFQHGGAPTFICFRQEAFRSNGVDWKPAFFSVLGLIAFFCPTHFIALFCGRQTCFMVVFFCISATSKFGDVNTPLGCCLLIVAPHGLHSPHSLFLSRPHDTLTGIPPPHPEPLAPAWFLFA